MEKTISLLRSFVQPNEYYISDIHNYLIFYHLLRFGLNNIIYQGSQLIQIIVFFFKILPNIVFFVF